MSELTDAVIIRRWAEVGAEVLRSHRAELNALNVFPVPDGDTGTNLYLTFRAAAEAEASRTGAADDARDALNAMARGALLGARGNSGVILAQVLQAVAASASQTSGGLNFRDIMVTVAHAARSAVADPQEGTALTVLDAAAAALAREPSVAASAARESLERTTDMLPILRAAGVVDAGGRGAVLLLDALNAIWHGADTWQGAAANAADVQSPPVGFVPDSAPHAAACDADAAYEVMFVVPSADASAVISAIEPHGVSFVVTSGQDLTHIHIHGDAPELIIARAHSITEVRHIRMESLTSSPKARALVAQAFGSGIVRLLVDAGVVVVPCEPDSRASVQDFVSAALKSGAAEVVLLPGDKDSLAVADIAARELAADGVAAVMVPTQFVTETLAAVAIADLTDDLQHLVSSMSEASRNVATVGISIATRESSTPAGHIAAGEYLVSVAGEIRAARPSLVQALGTALDEIPDPQLVTVIVGHGVTAEERSAALELLEQRFENAEFDIVDGHQDVWRLIVGFE